MILEDIKIQCEGTMKLYCDNKSTINIAHNPIQYDHTKHVKVDRHFIKEKLVSDLIYIPYISTDRQLVDILTKGFAGHSLYELTSKLLMDNRSKSK